MKKSFLKILMISLVTTVVLTGPWERAAKAANGDTASLSVSVTVGEDCTISGASLVFGSFDGTELTASTGVTVACTVTGFPWQVSFDNGDSNPDPASRTLSGPNPANNESIQYNIYDDPQFTNLLGDDGLTNNGMPHTGAGTETFSVFGQILPQAGPFSSGFYNDTVTMTLTF
jgi:spore coat protein U domain-containing protein, fimbrial subunit CupE1/2/3/6